MIIANFGNEKEKYVSGLDQYDYGQVLRIQGLNLPTAVEIHFGLEETGGTTVTRVGTTKDGVTDVVIPDSMLENGDIDRNYMIYVFVYLSDEKSGETIRRITMKVDARSKPEAFDRPEDAELFREAIKTVNESAARSSESEKQAEGWVHGREDLPERAKDNAKYYSDQAKEDSLKTDADRKEVERLVESVSGIDRQVALVKDYSDKAQTSATNAALSEQAAKESENNAAQAKEGAEAAQKTAEKSAQKTTEDRTAVESAKGEVLQAKTDVEADRKVVEGIQKDVSQTGNAIQEAVQEGVRVIENAGIVEKQEISRVGTTQKSAVESAGVQAVENINFAKQTAIDDVQAEGTTQIGNVTAEGEKQIQSVQQAAQEIVADREQIAKNTTDIADLKQGKADAIIETASGEVVKTEISSDSNLVDLKVFGKSEQVQTTGANLFDDKQLLDEANKNYDKTLSGTGLWWFKIPASETVTVSTRNKKVTSNEYLVVSDVIGHESGGNVVWLSHPSEKLYDSATITPIDGNVWLGVNVHIQTIKTMLENVGGIMLNTGSVAKPFEPYTDGKQTPSPEYPQQIKSVGDKGNVKVDIWGKNLIDVSQESISSSYKTGKYNVKDGVITFDTVNSWGGDYIYFNVVDTTVNKDLTFQLKPNLPSASNIGDITRGCRIIFKAYDKFGTLLQDDKKFIAETTTISFSFNIHYNGYVTGTRITKKESIKFSDKVDRIVVGISFNDAYGCPVKVSDFQVEYGVVGTEYIPHQKKQSLILSTPNGLPGIKVESGGNYTDSLGQQWICDEIDLTKGKYVQRIKKNIFDGLEQWHTWGANPNGNIGFYYYLNQYQSVKISGSKCISNYLPYKRESWSGNEIGVSIIESVQGDLIYITVSVKQSDLTDVSTNELAVKSFKEFLKSKKDSGIPFEIYCKLMEPIETDLPPEIIEAYKQLHTNYPTTVISNDESAHTEVRYVADTKNYYLGREKILQNQILEIQNALISQKISGGGYNPS